MNVFKIEDKDREKLNALSKTIKEQTEIFEINDSVFIEKGNRQAAKRARTASLNVSKATKEYRAESIRILSSKA